MTKKGVPALGTVVSAAFALFFAFVLTLTELTDMISIGTLLAFAVVCAGVVVLRHQDPARPKDVPILMACYFFVCIMSALSIIYRWYAWDNYYLATFLLIMYILAPICTGLSFYMFPGLFTPFFFLFI